MRTIEKIIDTEYIMMGNFRIAQPLPTKVVRQVDPFLLLHHAGPKYHHPGDKGLNVEAHPHTGFEPVTFVFEGEVEHRDSLGNESIVKSGGVQWITAGKGIVHSEKASVEFLTRGGDFEIIQLWINLPARLKKTDPQYFGFDASDIPYYLSEDKKTRLNIISGQYQGIAGPITSVTEITAYTGLMTVGGKLNMSFEDSHNVIIYVLNGHIETAGRAITDKQLIVYKTDGKQVELTAKGDTKLLILAGEPLKEPVFNYGPFVLNSREEVINAINDYESGKMGFLD